MILMSCGTFVCPIFLCLYRFQHFRFAPGLKVLSYVGDKDSREGVRNRIREQWDELNVILTTYEVNNTHSLYFGGVIFKMFSTCESIKSLT